MSENEFKLNYLHICDTAFLSKNDKVNIVGIFNKINTDGFPAVSPKFSIITNITGPMGNYREKVNIVSPSGEKIMKVDKEVKIEKGRTLNLFVDCFNILFPEDGEYKIEVFIDDEPLDVDDNIKLIVRKKQYG